MNYFKIYNQIIQKARFRGLDKSRLDGYYEKHHIIPRCMNGSNNDDNLVLLTAREHFICHVLLCKIHPDNGKLLQAFHTMSHVRTKHQIRYVSSFEYQTLKENYSKVVSKRFKTSMIGNLNGRGNKGKIRSKEAREKYSKIFSGKPKPHLKGKPLSELHKEKLRGCRPCQSGKNHHMYGKKGVNNPLFKKKWDIVKCPYCGKEGGINAMPRWHFDNCKHKDLKSGN